MTYRRAATGSLKRLLQRRSVAMIGWCPRWRCYRTATRRVHVNRPSIARADRFAGSVHCPTRFDTATGRPASCSAARRHWVRGCVSTGRPVQRECVAEHRVPGRYCSGRLYHYVRSRTGPARSDAVRARRWVSGHLAALTRLSVPSSDIFAIPALVAVGAFSAYLLVMLLLALPLMDKAEVEALCFRPRFSPHWRDKESVTIAVRVVVAVAAASLLSLPLGVNHSYWVVMVAGAVLQVSHVSRFSAIRAMHRVLGTVFWASLSSV
jgi:hypothetical protein